MYVTDRGRPAHVLLTYEAYEQLLGTQHVLERTETFSASDVVGATVQGSEGELEVVDRGGRRRLSVPAGLAERLA